MQKLVDLADVPEVPPEVPAKAAKTAQLGQSEKVQRTLALVVALLLAISGGVAVKRFGPGGEIKRKN